MPLYYCELKTGFCAIRKAKNRRQAWNALKREEGVNNARRVRCATKDDIAWIEGMGGYIPPKEN